MGLYINLGNDGFQSARNGEYVDKSDLIRVVNSTLNTELRFSCVSRCRRFGKSMAAKMLCAYYDQSCDSRSLFSDLNIANDPYDKSVETAIDQIKRRHYTAKVQEYAGHDLLLVGICYDRETKQHTCRIEPFTKE